MLARLAGWGLILPLWTAAQTGSTVADVIALVRSTMAARQPDAQVAKALHKVRLYERLDDYVIEELESEGAGPKAVGELVMLHDASSALKAPASVPVFEHEAPPADVDRTRILTEARAAALNYSRSLPDFICNESVHRYTEVKGKWDLRDTLELRLSFFDQSESYRLLTINGHQAVRRYEDVGGTISQGEFGSLLRQVFERQAAADFQWDHWTTLRKRPAYVFAFRVKSENSLYRMEFGTGTGFRYSVVAGQHGYVYVDRDSRAVVRIFAAADSIPPDFPVQTSTTLLDYDFSDVGGRMFLLPLRADVRLGAIGRQTRNDVEFHSYRKFSTDSTITYGR